MSLLLARDVTGLQGRLDRLFEAVEGTSRAFHPAVDIAENPAEFVLHIELPGLKKEDIGIQLLDDTLVVSGERKRESSKNGEHFHRIERSYGKFSRTFHLEKPIEAAKVTAAYEDGVLVVRLPKQAQPGPRPIQIQVKGSGE